MKALLSKISLFLLLTLSTMFTMQTVILTKAYEKIDEVSYNYDDITISDLILNDEEVELANEYIRLQIDDGNIGIIPRSLAGLAGTFFIPGVGQAVITTAGVIIVGGAIVSAGSWLGQKITDWVNNYKFNSSAEKAVEKAGRDNNKIHHIMNPKHNWNKFFNNPNWNNVAPILVRVLKEGSEKWERANIYVKTLYYNGQVVEVRFIKDLNGFIEAISTAWVK